MSAKLDELILQAQTVLDTNGDEMVESLRGLLRIPSLEAPAEPNAPFGQENRKALDFMLDLSKKHGLRTVDLEGYCGFAEYGKGDAMVMSLGHVDVVPVGPGWKFPPFGAEIHDGYIYCRGATDDKGPTMAMFYAASALKEVWPDIPVRIRQVFGCNEESGFKCVHHYVEKEEAPTLGVAPDAGWPLIHAEKGIAGFVLTNQQVGTIMRLTSLQGGQRPNIVIDHCNATVEIQADYLDILKEKIAESWDKNLTLTLRGNILELEATGKAAHGAGPWNGDNAAIRIFRFLKDAAPLADEKAYQSLFNMGHPGGQFLGISGSDELTVLTANLGIVGSENGRIDLTINVRYPVTWKGDDLRANCEAGLPEGWSIKEFTDSPPLYFPLDHPLVDNIVAAYREETGDETIPGTMGGGTYARAVPNCVAIGTSWPGDGVAHETDERVSVDGLLKTAKIYVRILARLAVAAENLV